MKIHHVIGYMAPEFGGPVVSLANYARGQSDLGNDVTVFSVDGYSDTSEAVAIGGSVVHRQGRVAWPEKLGRSVELKRLIAEPPLADVYHLHGIWMRAMLYGKNRALSAGRPYLVEINGALDPLELRRKPWRKRIARLLYQDEILRRANCIHVNSTREAYHVRSLGFKNPIVVIPAGFNSDSFYNLAVRKSPWWLAEVGERRVLLYLSRIHKDKGIDDLLEAWSVLADSFKDWVLLIVGPGADAEVARRKEYCTTMGISSRCIWAGLVSDEERAVAYKSADLYVLPSYKENFGNTVQESLGCGTPVLTTDQTPWLHLGEWGCGWTCSNNVRALTTSLRDCLSLPSDVLVEMGRVGSEVIRDRFSIEYVVHQQLSTYRWLLGEAPPPDCFWKQ